MAVCRAARFDCVVPFRAVVKAFGDCFTVSFFERPGLAAGPKLHTSAAGPVYSREPALQTGGTECDRPCVPKARGPIESLYTAAIDAALFIAAFSRGVRGRSTRKFTSAQGVSNPLRNWALYWPLYTLPNMQPRRMRLRSCPSPVRMARTKEA